MSDLRQRGLWVNWRVGEGSYVVMSTWLKITMDYSTTWILFKCIDGQPNIDSQSFNIRFSSFEKPIDDDWHFGDKYNSMLWCNIWNAYWLLKKPFLHISVISILQCKNQATNYNDYFKQLCGTSSDVTVE